MRRTGHSFRLLLRSLNEASHGSIVFYASVGDHGKYYFDAAVRICKSYLSPEGAIFAQRTISFPSGGKLYFENVKDEKRFQDKLIGLKSPKIYEDD